MIKIAFGDVRRKRIITPNHFVSHMIEHVAWRMGLSIELEWESEEWLELGRLIGSQIRQLPHEEESAPAFGMIDDGSAVVSLSLGKRAVRYSSAGGVDLNWFLSCRCEQIASGKPLLDLAEGLSEGLNAEVTVQIWSVEDPHHTWEGIFRGIGIALSRIFTPSLDSDIVQRLSADHACERNEGTGEIVVVERGVNQAKVHRGTAETGVTVEINFSHPPDCSVHLKVDKSISAAIDDIEKLLSVFTKALGAQMQVAFNANDLSSSHVVMEDIGLVVGRSLLECMKLRMDRYGVNGAGSNLKNIEDIQEKNVQVGISVEGRKFWRLIPEDGDYGRFRRACLIGRDVYRGLRSEDLDDFIDGLAGGMGASIMVHIRDYSEPDRVWPEIFEGLGSALRQSFLLNPYRRGVPPGVKATLA